MLFKLYGRKDIKRKTYDLYCVLWLTFIYVIITDVICYGCRSENKFFCSFSRLKKKESFTNQ